MRSYPHVQSGGASVVQIEHGATRNLIVILFASCLISALAVTGLIWNYAAMKTLQAKYEVLQYDHQALKAQLVSQGLYEGTEH